MQSHLLLHGNAFAQIYRRSGTGEIMRLKPIHPSRIIVKRDGDEPTYEYLDKNGQRRPMAKGELWHLAGLGCDGYEGYSVIEMARESLGLSLAAEQYGGKFFAAGGRVPYILKHPQRFQDDAAFEKFKLLWKDAYASADSWHAAPVLEGGMEYEQIGMKPEDAQFLATRQFQVPEIARWFKVSPHKVGDLSRATFSNIEHLNIEFLTETLSYWLKVWEQGIWLHLLTDAEKDRYYAEFNTDAILRGDAKSQAEAMSIQIQNSLLTPNEGRRLYNRPAVTGGDVNMIQLNMQSLPGQDQLTSQQKAEPNGNQTPRPNA